MERDRWVVLKRRDCTSAIALLEASLKSGGRDVGVASEPRRAFQRKVEILNGVSIGKLATRNPAFARALSSFLSGRPTWLE